MSVLGYGLCFILSWLLTGVFCRMATARLWLDIPNTRSAHVTPIPRGAGVVFVVCFLGGLLVLQATHELLSYRQFACLFFPLMGIALLGFCDDRWHLSAYFRLLGHGIAAITVLYGLSGIGGLAGIPEYCWLSGLLNTFIVVSLVWFLNLFNFMDGLDGLAAVETLSICLGGVFLGCFSGFSPLESMALLLAACMAGFLLWNFPPARVFMGDAGSGFLGLLMGFFLLLAGYKSVTLFYGWLILYGVFVMDASITLISRALRGENILTAHCTHAYQYAARRFGQHRSVTLAVLLINLCWLFPFALAVQQHWLAGWLALIIAWLPLMVLVIFLRKIQFDVSGIS